MGRHTAHQRIDFGLAVLAVVLPWHCATAAIRGAVVPWTTYEAENMTNSNGTVIGPQYQANLVGSESSGRRCVRLDATGQYVQFIVQEAANAVVVRYSVPDTSDGVGADYTLSLFRNGTFVQKLPLSSRYSWLYGAYPFNNNPSSGIPRNFYDEVRLIGLTFNAGDTLGLEKDADDTAAYYIIDLVDLENVAAPLNAPSDSLSVTNYGAVADGGTDCTTALRNCIAAAQVQGKAVWIPAGTYLITGTVNLPSGTKLQGAGMWYTTLIGSASLYNTTPSRRLNLNGAGTGIHLSDFAIFGFLNYRNDTEPNDGLGGSYGNGSTISRVWVEHTKTAAWILNSQGLVVDSCRFRNTLADGINVNRGMRSTIVTNCTARGTGDDGFAIWPSPGSQAYAPGLNVITHCTAQTPFLANGGAIYGGQSNRIEDCLFQDIVYDCGILISTTFPVGSNAFSGTTVAQRCDLLRCGNNAGLQLCLQTNSLSGIDLNNLNIIDSIADGLSIIAPGSIVGTGLGTLSAAAMSNVSIPDYGLGYGGKNGLWARNDAIGSMSVSNSTIVQYRDDSTHFTFDFAPPAQSILSITISGRTNVILTYAATPGATYHIESAPSLSPTFWTTVPGSMTNASRSIVTFTIPVVADGKPLFYRTASP
jgi:hypothetical protein